MARILSIVEFRVLQRAVVVGSCRKEVVGRNLVERSKKGAERKDNGSEFDLAFSAKLVCKYWNLLSIFDKN